MTRRILALLALFIASVAQAQAQSANPIYLLSYPSVQKELALSTAAVKKLAQIRQDDQRRHLALISPTASSPNTTHNATSAEMEALFKKTEAATLAVLNAQQKARLREVGYQYLGGFALADPAVVKALHITPQQTSKLWQARSAVNAEFTKVFNAVGKPGHLIQKKPHDPRVEARRLTDARIQMMTSLDAKVAKILTSAQLAQWKQMKGRPFAVASLYAPTPTKSPARL